MSNHTKLTPKKKETFFEIIRTTGNVSKAARTIGIARRYVYEVKDRDGSFSKEWEDAYQEFLDDLEDAARKRAVDGVESQYYDKDGNCIRTRTEYSDTLMIFLLKGGRPEKYRELYKHEHGGVEGKEIVIDFQITGIGSNGQNQNG